LKCYAVSSTLTSRLEVLSRRARSFRATHLRTQKLIARSPPVKREGYAELPRSSINDLTTGSEQARSDASAAEALRCVGSVSVDARARNAALKVCF